METLQLVESEQLENTPSENIKHFEVEGNKVTAVFHSASDAAKYIKKYSAFKYSPKWYDQIGFANFNVEWNKIHAYSTYHPTSSLIRMFNNGLKNLSYLI